MSTSLTNGSSQDVTEMPLYLDYNATTPMAPEVLEAMLPWLNGRPCNAGSRTHSYGQQAKEAVDQSRAIIAQQFDAAPEDLVFTSGATESNNLLFHGLAAHGEKTGRKQIITTAIEHKAVLEPLEQLRARGFQIEIAPVTAGGFVEPAAIRALASEQTLLISVMHANNETGVIQPVEQACEIAHSMGALFHIDAAQTFGKLVPELRQLPCDFASISGHKIYGPMGIGALLVRQLPKNRRKLQPLQHGGGQERGLRPGTLPVPLIVGFARAAELAAEEFSTRAENAAAIKAQLLTDIAPLNPIINGDQTRCMPHVINVAFPGVDSEALMMATRNEISISNGSACTSSAYKPSHVLLAMGIDEQTIESSVRISWGASGSAVPADILTKFVSQFA